MRILIVGKYPPIQGGVSRSVYWAAQMLAQQGHQVRVVTNAFEAEYGTRQMLYGDDHARLESADHVHRIEIIATEHPVKFRYLPFANPFVSRLAGLIETSLEAFSPDIVIASYFEPYCVATAFATFGRDIPVYMTHAGSDLAFLAKNAELYPTYRRALRRADRVLTLKKRPGAIRLLEALDVPRERMLFTFGNAIEPIFQPPGPEFDFGECFAAFGAHMAEHSPFEPAFQARILALNAAPIDPMRPKLGIFGKIGPQKGSFQLLDSLARLARKGVKAHLFCIPCGHETMIRRFLERILADAHLTETVRILPPITHWRIPTFIRAMSACFFLEHEFSVAIHSPRVAREILATGSALILAGEQVERMRIGEQLVDKTHYIRVPNPSHPPDLDAAIRFALADPARLDAIGQKGSEIGLAFEASRKSAKQRIVQAVEMLHPA